MGEVAIRESSDEWSAQGLHFLSAESEINWLLIEADLGHTKAQHRLGRLYLKSGGGAADLIQAYKWLFISTVLGNDDAKDDLMEVCMQLTAEQDDEAYRLTEVWAADKFDEVPGRDESQWSPELLRWRFAPSFVN
jgi:TPR repeat protein